MLSVIATIIYSCTVMMALGLAFNKLFSEKKGYIITGIDNLIIAGMIIATIYAQTFSLFYKVGLLANIILIVISIIILFIYRRDFFNCINKLKGESVYKSVFYIITFVIVAFFTSRGYIHYDSDLYHAQSIRWIEEYGAVKGLGNLHNRIAYNSALFSITALFSLKPVMGQSMHVINGIIAILTAWNIWPLFGNLYKKAMKVSDFIRLGMVYYLVSICQDINSPASDYSILLIVFLIILKWSVLLEKKELSAIPYALLCMVGVYAVTLKLSACVILLLMVKPIVGLIKEKSYKDILIFFIFGLVISLPWFARNIILSGYLIYPFPAIDLFNVDWKVPIEEAIYDANEIKAWGKVGFDSLQGMEKILVTGAFISIGVFVIKFVIELIAKKIDYDRILLMFTVVASFIFWQQTAPLIRYGYTYVLLVVFMTAGYLYEDINKKYPKAIKLITLFLTGMFLMWKSVSLVKNIVRFADAPFYYKQIDYNNDYEAVTYEIDGVDIYRPVTGDRIGYEKFPASVFEQNIELRGSSLREGFRVNDAK